MDPGYLRELGLVGFTGGLPPEVCEKKFWALDGCWRDLLGRMALGGPGREGSVFSLCNATTFSHGNSQQAVGFPSQRSWERHFRNGVIGTLTTKGWS